MTEERKDGKAALDRIAQDRDHIRKRRMKGLFLLMRIAINHLRLRIKADDTPGISWRNPWAQLEFDAALPPGDFSKLLTPAEAAALAGRADLVFTGSTALQTWTQNVLIRKIEPVMEDGRLRNCRVILPPALREEVESLPESEREARLTKLTEGHTFPGDSNLPGLGGTGEAATPAGRQAYAFELVFTIQPLTITVKGDRAFFPVIAGLKFTEGDPGTWSEEDRDALFEKILKGIDDLDARVGPWLEEREAEGKPDHVRAVRPEDFPEYFKAPARFLDTPRHAAAQKNLPAIEAWYLQTAFNRTVGMAAAALTKTKTREDILGVQKATVEEIEDLVFWREEGTPAHGQHRQDILKAFEALRAIPVPIVKVDWKQIGTGRNPRFVKVWKLGVGQLIQTYWPFWKERATGKIVYAADPGHKKDLVASKRDRRKKTRELVGANPVAALLQVFPPDKYEFAGLEWRWNTDIAQDFICPQVALTEDNRPRLKLKGGRHIEGSRFVMVNRRYFAVQKHLRAQGMKYAPRLLDVIISEKKHITSRGKGAVWIEIEAEKVVKWLDLWEDYKQHPKHVLEDHIQEAIQALIAEGVMLPGSRSLPETPPNKKRRVADYYRWKVAELWSTVALVPPEEAKEIEAEMEADAAKAAAPALPPALPGPGIEQAVLPGMELPPAPPLPAGADIRAARDAAGVSLRDFAQAMKGPGISIWSRYIAGKPVRVENITPDTWQLVRDFIAKHGSKAGPEGGPVT
jgi:hypothetical protein